MKIKVTSGTENYMQERDYSDFIEITIDNKLVFEVSDGEPEDSNLGRDFGDCYLIPNLLEMAYKAGKNGECFEIENCEVDSRW